MATLTPRGTPAVEAVRWDGTNDDEIVDLVERVQALHLWGPLEAGAIRSYVNPSDEVHPGLNITAGEDGGTPKWPIPATIVVRVEEGNYVVFDPFATTPLAVMLPEHVAAFYEVQ